MLESCTAVVQAVLATVFTWGLTAAGASLVFFFNSKQQKILDSSLGFAAGVMIAASFWSLLEPALEAAKKTGSYGASGEWAFVPVAIGFVLGAYFVYVADVFMHYMNIHSPYIALALKHSGLQLNNKADDDYENCKFESTVTTNSLNELPNSILHQRSINTRRSNKMKVPIQQTNGVIQDPQDKCWQRILLLILAITVHNIPEGLAVGVGFGAVNKTESATFQNARNLAIGIGIQNFPEGLAVSLPLRAVGMSKWKSFWYGQLSGLVEPIAGVIGAIAVTLIEPSLPYALAFAAGAMIYVVIDDIVPQAHTCGNAKLASWSSVMGFLVMMVLDVGLG